VTTGPGFNPTLLGPLPPAVRTAQFLPQAAVLPHCRAVVSHAGAGTMLGALCYGLPQLCLPQGTDQPSNTAALLPTGAALALQPDEITADTVAEALGQLLNEPSFREAANRLRAEIERMPPPRPSSTTSWSPPTSDRHPQATPPATDIPAIRPKATGSQQHHQHLPRERNTSRVAAAPTLSRR